MVQVLAFLPSLFSVLWRPPDLAKNGVLYMPWQVFAHLAVRLRWSPLSYGTG